MGLNKSEGKLLEKFNLSVTCLDYSYIENSRNVKELENILIVLRSGEEGVYPDLTKFCENKLHELAPDSKHLQLPKQISTSRELTRTEQEALEQDIQNWANTMKECDSRLSQSSSLPAKEIPFPVRNSMPAKHVHDNASDEQKPKKMKNASDVKGNGKKSNKPRSYAEWDKFNADEELKKFEDLVPKTELQTHAEENAKNVVMHPFIDVSGMTESECAHVAEQEKVKGNEAIKIQNYVEAELYYSRSISAHPTVAAFNNRAFANIKMQKFDAALFDCNAVLNLEPDNVKALYRRGLVHKEAGRVQLAYADFQTVLDLEPPNKAAKEQLHNMEMIPSKPDEKASPVMIQELSETCDVKSDKVAAKQDSAFRSSSQKNSSEDFVKRAQSKSVPEDAALKEISGAPGSLSSVHKETWKTSNACKRNDLLTATKKIVFDKEEKRGDGAKTEKCANSSFTDDEKTTQKGKQRENFVVKSVSKGVRPHKPLQRNWKAKEQKFIELKPSLYKCDKGSLGNHVCCAATSDNSLVILQNVDERLPEYVTENSLARKECLVGKTVTSDRVHDIRIMQSDNKKIADEKSVPLESKRKLESATFPELYEEITPFKFLTLWHNMSASKDSSCGMSILKRIKPEQLPSIISNRLDGDLLSGIICAISQIVEDGDVEYAYEYMLNLPKVPRIKTICAFLSAPEQTEIKHLICKFNEYGKDVDYLQKMFL